MENREKKLISTAEANLIMTSATDMNYFWTEDKSHCYTYKNNLLRWTNYQKKKRFNEPPFIEKMGYESQRYKLGNEDY